MGASQSPPQAAMARSIRAMARRDGYGRRVDGVHGGVAPRTVRSVGADAVGSTVVLVSGAHIEEVAA